ncbi:MAG TPA: sigma-70 family RNA polymerase sigma factor [Pseudonocardiaceae bacterium]|nr:sigma-70 family RNA polymerase sigma factor [Pseudonocardiaceae bacterium]
MDGLAERFEAHRGTLRAVAYRMLGSVAEADDAVQETWLRLSRVDADTVDNLGGWLRTVLSRVCLDVLRARESRREVPTRDDLAPDDPEREAVLADSVGRALLVVLDRLGHAERVAFVLHDMFAVPFDEIAPIVGRTPVAAKKLASRARSRVRGAPAVPGDELARQRRVVDAFLAASRAGDVDAVLAVLSPDVVRRADPMPGRATEVRGARQVAREIAVFGRNARYAEVALVGGAVGIVVAPAGRLTVALACTVDGDRIAGYDLVTDPDRLRALDVAVLSPR